MVNIFDLIDTVYDNSYLIKKMFGNYQSLLALLIDKKVYLEKELVLAVDVVNKLKNQLLRHKPLKKYYICDHNRKIRT